MVRRISVYDSLDTLAELDAYADTLETETAPAEPPSPVHARTLEVMQELVQLGQDYSGPDTPLALRATILALDRSRPLMLDLMARIEPAQLAAFMAQLAAQLQSIADTYDGPPADYTPPAAVEPPEPAEPAEWDVPLPYPDTSEVSEAEPAEPDLAEPGDG